MAFDKLSIVATAYGSHDTLSDGVKLTADLGIPTLVDEQRGGLHVSAFTQCGDAFVRSDSGVNVGAYAQFGGDTGLSLRVTTALGISLARTEAAVDRKWAFALDAEAQARVTTVHGIVAGATFGVRVSEVTGVQDRIGLSVGFEF